MTIHRELPATESGQFVGEEAAGIERAKNPYSHLNKEQVSMLLAQNAVQLVQAREFVLALEAGRDVLLEQMSYLEAL